MMSREGNIRNSVFRSKINRLKTLKECFMEGCQETPINAHSIQQNGALSLIESEINGNQSVYTFTELELNVNNESVFRPIGKRQASTFFGFCNKHDTEIFQEIENSPNGIDLNTAKHKFLLSFRAFAISYHRKKEDVKLFISADESLRKEIKKHSDIDDEGYEKYISGSKIAVEEMKPQRDFLINALNTGDFDCLHFLSYSVDHSVQFTSTMYTSPPYLFSGEEINISEDTNFEYSDIISTVIPLQNRAIVVLASFKDRPKGIKYLEEIDSFQKREKEIALTWHFLTNSENVFFSPNAFNSLPEGQQRKIIELYLDSKDLNKPYLKFDSKKFDINLFEKP